ncbi:hypothetical protein ACI48D_08810 [Massilia sp. LXY-6]|uniref:hypothetical protein n=1 Tax=Massilia sp. LXY-6 TaxID=3379823 RepID=UPI003EE3893F
MLEVEWEPCTGCDYDYQKAEVTKLACDETQVTVQFKGWSTGNGQHYQGVVRLPLSMTNQPAFGTCKLGDKDAPFRLVGAFMNEEFTRYEGIWHEDPDYTATFSFDAKA